MRSRYPSSSFASSFGPGPLTPAIKVLVAANVGAFLLSLVVPAVTLRLGLRPADVVENFAFWQPVTYMFLHGGIFHILFNMLALWMFGVELERMWGSRFFVKFYFVAGVGAALTTMLCSFLPFAFANQLYYSLTIGASGAVYGDPARLRALFSASADPAVLRLPDSGEVLCDDHRRDLAAVGDERTRAAASPTPPTWVAWLPAIYT